MKTRPNTKTMRSNEVSAWTLLLGVAALSCLCGLSCAHRGGMVEESSDYSYEDVAAQIRAEDAVAEAEREESGR